ncbi:uncharacterized protein LOC116507695 [Thamnophis elegans]|uniref:uncharacterized protein LOC116507695 n=1 Tax=Thamnophis elegans TaxID=35005 RepID=UPI00137657BD|nr:uncharacterized protein LOC116507695 [Thamnophis elegans]
MISPAASTSGHSKGFSMKSFKSILKSDTTSVKMTSEPRTSMGTVEYMKAFPDQENDTAEGKSELASVQSQTSISMTQDLPIPCKKEDVVVLHEYEGDEEAEITIGVRPGQELTLPEQLMKKERSDSKQLEHFPHRRQDGVAFLDEYEGDEEEAEIAIGVKPGQELTVPELFMKRERSDSKQLERFPHRKEDGVAFLDDFIGDEEEQLRYVPSASHKKEDELVVEDIEDVPNDYQEQLKSTATLNPTEENKTSTSLKDSGKTSPQKEQ